MRLCDVDVSIWNSFANSCTKIRKKEGPVNSHHDCSLGFRNAAIVYYAPKIR